MTKITSMCAIALAAFALTSCSDNEPEKEPVYKTISFEDCQFATEKSVDNFAASGSSNTYTEFGADFTNANIYYSLSGILVASKAEQPQTEGSYVSVASDRKVVCNAADDDANHFTGADKTDKYSIWAYSTYKTDVIPSFSFADGVEHKVNSIEVNNVAKYWQIMKIGYYTKKGFAEGDFYEVNFIGYDATGKQTGSVPVILADYRNGKTFIMDTWTKVDLSALGKVNKIELTATPSDKLKDLLYGDTYSVCVDQIEFDVTDETNSTK